MPLILGTNSIKDTGFDVANSCRFDGSSSKLVKSQSAGNRDLWTYSVWIKRCAITTTTTTFFASSDGSNLYAYIGIQSHKIRFLDYNSGNQTNLITNRLFRDPSAWYHVVLTYDSAQSTASNRVKLYINGVQETSFSTETYPSQNLDSAVNVNSSNFIISSNQDQSSGSMWNGYMAESCFVDGQALAPTSFGEFDEDSGIWKPINVSGLTFGTNGFYLDFEDSANLGNDANGGTDFTESGLASTDQSTDTCTNNFCTMNPLDNYYAASTFSEGNLKFISQVSGFQYNTATFGLSQGKWYFEVKLIAAANNDEVNIGIAGRTTESTTGYLGLYNDTYGMYGDNGKIYNGGSSSSYGVAYTVGDIIGVYMDLDNNKLYYAKNGTIMNSGTGKDITVATSTTTGFYFPALGDFFGGQTGTFEVNFGNPTFSISSGNTDPNGYGNFEYDPSAGTFDGSSKDFLAINTKNLSEYG